MLPPHRILCALSITLPSSAFVSGTFFFLRSSSSSSSALCATLPRSFSSSISTMPYSQRKGGQKWKEKPKTDSSGNNRLGEWSASGSSGQTQALVQPIQFGRVQVNPVPVQGQKGIWKPKSYGTVGRATTVEAEAPADKSTAGLQRNGVGLEAPQKSSSGASKVFKGNLLENFTVDNSTYAQVQIRATFYPKFENEKSDQEIRTRMIEMVSKGLATLEVSLKHSGSLFMYAGNEGGAYAKNSFGNIYTAVGVFVLGRMFREAWGSEAAKKQAEFNDFLERNHMCISMELVTAVLGDHGQRPNEDFVVVTAVTELGNGKPKFYSTPEIIAFCRKWRLPTNHIWLFSTR
uniref:uncharacterized protein LOC105352482 n=1 Tax=Fragaria vesca subsp. vesca TaxID=101020 RepID=UPI0005C89AEE|nr:PREDICTED: uncharacterized protein LOC105352482 [Fragaria vesca subsp. vesca]